MNSSCSSTERSLSNTFLKGRNISDRYLHFPREESTRLSNTFLFTQGQTCVYNRTGLHLPQANSHRVLTSVLLQSLVWSWRSAVLNNPFAWLDTSYSSTTSSSFFRRYNSIILKFWPSQLPCNSVLGAFCPLFIFIIHKSSSHLGFGLSVSLLDVGFHSYSFLNILSMCHSICITKQSQLFCFDVVNFNLVIN